MNDKIKTVLSEIKEKLKDKKDILEIKAYGSQINGNATWDSDLDMYFLLKTEDKHLINVIDDTLYHIGSNHDIFISSVYFFDYEMKMNRYEYSPFYNSVMKTGVNL